MKRIWVHDPIELLDIDFIPHKDDSIAEQTNAVSRFVLFSSIIIAYYRKNMKILIAGGLLMIAIAQQGEKLIKKRKRIEAETAKVPTEMPAPDDDTEQSAALDYVNRTDAFAHFAYGDINRGMKK